MYIEGEEEEILSEDGNFIEWDEGNERCLLLC